MGELLAEAGMEHYRNVCLFRLPVALMRGGELECTVTFSDQEITSMGTLYPLTGIVMGRLALENLGRRVKGGGVLVVDSSIVSERIARDDVTVHYIPASSVALGLGSNRVSNMVLLGAYVVSTGVLPLELAERTVARKLAGGRGEALIPLNIEALRKGAELVG